jgi:hypothetical protein
MVDFFLLLKLPEPEMNCKESNAGLWKWRIDCHQQSGWGYQKSKTGKSEFNRALHLFRPKIRWTPNRYLQLY